MIDSIDEPQSDSGAAEWSRRPERGAPILLRLMTLISLHCGRPAARVILYLTAGYFFLFAPAARRSCRDYLPRALGRKARAVDRFRLLLYFAASVHDRVFLANDRCGLFDISTDGEGLVKRALNRGTGAFLMGAHMGSFEVIRSIGQQQGLRVAMVMYEENARKISALLAAINPAAAPDIIALGHLNAMLRIRARLDAGGFVGMLGDRTLGDATQTVSFLGVPAQLPVGPLRVAALLRRPVIFMLGLYRGGNRYHVVFERLADFSQTPPGERDAAVKSAIARYGMLLEKYCRSDPYNWFNFFDFWRRPHSLPRSHER